MKWTYLLLLALSLAPAYADEKHHLPAGDGEVRRIDRDAQKITIRHGPLPSLDMPQPMTMVYRVKDAAVLERFKPGDKVKFHAEKVGGVFTVMAIELAK